MLPTRGVDYEDTHLNLDTSVGHFYGSCISMDHALFLEMFNTNMMSSQCISPPPWVNDMRWGQEATQHDDISLVVCVGCYKAKKEMQRVPSNLAFRKRS